MTKTEQKVFDYAQSVGWDYSKIIAFVHSLENPEWRDLGYKNQAPDVKAFIEKYKPKDWREGVEELKEWAGYKEGGEYNFLTITIPIEDYNRLRKLEIKQQIKKLKKELCELNN
ncbi:MAG: hypothetical protein KBT36_14020 [Kurthia sp.]|nr:hypothetical protein [Candidatus Kurthia equi]